MRVLYTTTAGMKGQSSEHIREGVNPLLRCRLLLLLLLLLLLSWSRNSNLFRLYSFVASKEDSFFFSIFGFLFFCSVASTFHLLS